MIARHFFLALATAALIAGCGGGEQSASATAQSAVAALQAAKGSQGARLSQAVSPDAAADQLMDFAESNLPGFFPSHQPSMSLAPFRFRYYPETNIYLGVVVTAGSSYTLNGVYVAGGGLGTLANPYYAGLLTQFITPTGGTGGNASACYDLALADTQGTKIEISYNYSGTITGTENVTSTVGGMTTFEGHSARETTVATTGSHNTPEGNVAINTTGKYYGARTGDTQMTSYGFETVAGGSTQGISFTNTIRAVYNPPSVDNQYGLAAGQSVTATQTGTMTSTMHFTGSPFPIPDQVSTQSITTTSTTKFVGIESVSVPAGTYSACKFEVTAPGSNDVTTNWFIAGKGLHVKSMAGGSAPLTIEATSVKLNGAAQ